METVKLSSKGQVAGCLHQPGRKMLTDDEEYAAVRRIAKQRDDATKTLSNARLTRLPAN